MYCLYNLYSLSLSSSLSEALSLSRMQHSIASLHNLEDAGETIHHLTFILIMCISLEKHDGDWCVL